MYEYNLKSVSKFIASLILAKEIAGRVNGRAVLWYDWYDGHHHGQDDQDIDHDEKDFMDPIMAFTEIKPHIIRS